MKSYVDNKTNYSVAISFGSDVTVGGNLTVNGTTTTVNTSTITTKDSLIKLADGNSADSLDVGFYGQYGSSGIKYAGLFRKAADKFYLVKDVTTDPTGNTVTFTSANRAVVDASLTGGTVSGLSSAVAIADGGTNATSFTSNQRVVFDGTKLASRANTTTTVTGSIGADKTITSFTTNAYGEVTAYTGASIAIASGAVSGLAASATTDTTSATNISSGTLDAARLATSGVTAATHGSASSVPVFVVDNKGRVTSVSNTTIAIASGAVSGLAASATTDTTSATNIGSGTLDAARLATSGVTAATHGSASSVPVFVVDTKGRVTSVSNTTIAIASGAVSGLAASATTDTTNAGNIGSGTLPNARLSSVPNSALANPSFYIGTTSVSLGRTSGALSLTGINIDGSAGSAGSVTNGVYTTGDQSIGGTKTFTSKITGSISGNCDGNAAGTASNITAYTINQSVGSSNAVTFGSINVGSATSAGTGEIVAQGNITAYSDARLKTNLAKIENALEKVSQLTGYTYTRTDTGQKQTGLVAQDIEKVLPEAVTDSGDYKAVAYGNMMGLIVEAIKELKAEIDSLKKS